MLPGQAATMTAHIHLYNLATGVLVFQPREGLPWFQPQCIALYD